MEKLTGELDENSVVSILETTTYNGENCLSDLDKKIKRIRNIEQ